MFGKSKMYRKYLQIFSQAATWSLSCSQETTQQSVSSPIRTRLESEQNWGESGTSDTGVGANIKEVYTNWWELGATRMVSGEKPPVWWQGQAFRGKGNWTRSEKQTNTINIEVFQKEWNYHQKGNTEGISVTEIFTLKRAIRGSFQGNFFLLLFFFLTFLFLLS